MSRRSQEDEEEEEEGVRRHRVTADHAIRVDACTCMHFWGVGVGLYSQESCLVVQEPCVVGSESLFPLPHSIVAQ